jgi:hypothetical protein
VPPPPLAADPRNHHQRRRVAGRHDRDRPCRRRIIRPSSIRWLKAALIISCGVNPEAYFTDVLNKRVNSLPNSRFSELLPWGWPLGVP